MYVIFDSLLDILCTQEGSRLGHVLSLSPSESSEGSYFALYYPVITDCLKEKLSVSKYM
jgi:hypothetical protein